MEDRKDKHGVQASTPMGETSGKLPERIPATTSADIVAKFAKGTLGLLFPLVGTTLGVIVSSILPGQREDRIHALGESIARKVNYLEEAVARQKMTTQHAVDHLEDCLFSASRARSKERIEYIANLYVNRITSVELDEERDQQLVRLLDALTDAEVLMLAEIAEFSVKGVGGNHAGRPVPPPIHMGSPVADRDNDAIQAAWKNRLEELGLIRRKIRLDGKTRQPSVDSPKGDWKKHPPEATWLGRMLLNHIGIEDPIRHRQKASEGKHNDESSKQ